MKLTPRWMQPGSLLAGVVITCLAAVAIAYVSQHVFDLQPCPWCALQRAIYLAIALVCLLGLPLRHALVRAAAGLLGFSLALAGMAAAGWQHFYAAASISCDLTLAERLLDALRLGNLWPDMFIPRASCSEAAVNLLGMPYALWSLGLFAAIGVACGVLLRGLLLQAPR